MVLVAHPLSEVIMRSPEQIEYRACVYNAVTDEWLSLSTIAARCGKPRNATARVLMSFIYGRIVQVVYRNENGYLRPFYRRNDRTFGDVPCPSSLAS